jgi:hypothetical protein
MSLTVLHLGSALALTTPLHGCLASANDTNLTHH